METYNDDHLRHIAARKRMKEIKGFYIHMAVYVLVNSVIMLQFLLQITPESNAGRGFNFYTGVLWGIVILIHAVSIFLPGIRKWENRKTEELTKKYLKNQNHG